MSSTDIPLGSSDPAPALRKDLVTLQAQRDALEVEADAITSELKAPGPNGEAPVGVKGSLIDPDGFPLAGFDLFNVREKRHRLSCIQTDHKAIMARIEKSLHALHQVQASGIPSSNRMAVTQETDANSAERAGATTLTSVAASVSMVPIAKVNEVSEGSPADTAGLTVGDLILSFGEVDISHPRGLTGVVDVVREKEGQQVPVTVLRHGSEATTLTLVPKTWDGRGLLGVHLLPS